MDRPVAINPWIAEAIMLSRRFKEEYPEHVDSMDGFEAWLVKRDEELMRL